MGITSISSSPLSLFPYPPPFSSCTSALCSLRTSAFPRNHHQLNSPAIIRTAIQNLACWDGGTLRCRTRRSLADAEGGSSPPTSSSRIPLQLVRHLHCPATHHNSPAVI